MRAVIAVEYVEKSEVKIYLFGERETSAQIYRRVTAGFRVERNARVVVNYRNTVDAPADGQNAVADLGERFTRRRETVVRRAGNSVASGIQKRTDE